MSDKIKVRVVKEHGNSYGSTYRKAVGDEYDAPESMANSLAAKGIVEIAGAEPAALPARKSRKK